MLNKLSSTSPVSFIRKIEVAARKGMDGVVEEEGEGGREGGRARWGGWRKRGRKGEVIDPAEAREELGMGLEEGAREEGRSLEWERLITVV